MQISYNLMNTTTVKIDFSKLNEQEAKTLVFNHIRGTRYDRYLLAIEKFKQQFPDLFLKQPTHPIFHYEMNDMRVEQLELDLFYLDNKVLNIDEKPWEIRFFDALQIPAEQRIPRVTSNELWKQRTEEIENFTDENQQDTLDSKKNFVQQYVDEFNKSTKYKFGNFKNSKISL